MQNIVGVLKESEGEMSNRDADIYECDVCGYKESPCILIMYGKDVPESCPIIPDSKEEWGTAIWKRKVDK